MKILFFMGRAAGFSWYPGCVAHLYSWNSCGLLLLRVALLYKCATQRKPYSSNTAGHKKDFNRAAYSDKKAMKAFIPSWLREGI